jgi:hypothetical protein
VEPPKLTTPQQAAYDRIMAVGVVYRGDGVGLRTARRLEHLQLVVIEGSLHTWTNPVSRRTHSQYDWSVRPIDS